MRNGCRGETAAESDHRLNVGLQSLEWYKDDSEQELLDTAELIHPVRVLQPSCDGAEREVANRFEIATGWPERYLPTPR